MPKLTPPVNPVPPVRPWGQRLKAVYRLPGGYKDAFKTLRAIVERVVSQSPTNRDLAEWISSALNVSQVNADKCCEFLKRAAILDRSSSGILKPSALTRHWFNEERDIDDTVLVALIHSRVRFVGEMLLELSAPRSAEDLRIAAHRYGFKWATSGSVLERRAWLESAGLIEVDDDRRLARTSAGDDFLARLELHTPAETRVPHEPGAPTQTRESSASDSVEASDSTHPSVAVTTEGTADLSQGEKLAQELVAASTDSANHERFERAVCDAFSYLGFDASHLGKSGRTDVLLSAPQGRDDSYVTCIDAKSVGKGKLTDPQVDWPTLVEHRQKHGANYSMLVGPNPSGKRLFSRAKEHGVAVLSADDLAGLCRQHADTQLSLEAYRSLFDPGEADLSETSDAAENQRRLTDLTVKLLTKLASKSADAGAMNARELWLVLDDDASSVSSVDEIHEILRTLAHPLVGAIRATGEGANPRYIPATSTEVCQLRLQTLATRIATGEPPNNP